MPERTPPPVPSAALRRITDEAVELFVPKGAQLPPDVQELARLIEQAHAIGVAAGRKQAAADALRKIAVDVVGVSDPAQVHDDERLRFGAIRRALTEEPNHA